MKLGILKSDAVRPEWVPVYGEYPDMFMRLLSAEEPTLEYAVYDVQQGEYPSAIDAVDAYLITGSKASAYEDEPWIATLQQFVRELHRRRHKLLGICFGHQLVAQALGGRVAKSPAGWGVGLHTHHFTLLPDWHDGGDPDLRVLVSHEDQVVTVPPGGRVLAGSDFCEHAVMQIGDSILTFQGHPEFDPGYLRALMDFRRDQIGEVAYREGMASLARMPCDGPRVARWMLNFLYR